jgi:hypothetical protein
VCTLPPRLSVSREVGNRDPLTVYAIFPQNGRVEDTVGCGGSSRNRLTRGDSSNILVARGEDPRRRPTVEELPEEKL